MHVVRSRRIRRWLPASVVLAVLGSLLVWVPGATAATVPVGAPPGLPAGAVLQGAPAPATALHLTVSLRPQDPAALAAFVQAVSTPGSAQYGHYLTTAQFADRFGASPAAVQAARDGLAGRGLAVGPVAADHLSMDVDTTVAGAEAALGVGLRTARLASGRAVFLNTAPPRLPAGAAPAVQAILGLDDLARAAPEARPVALPAATGPVACTAAANETAQGAYTPAQLATAYGFNGLYAAGALGAGQTVAVFELSGYRTSDVAAYQSCFGTAASVQNLAVDGGARDNLNAIEDVLDIEGIIGLAPQAALRVYEGPNTATGIYDTYRSIVNDPTRASVLSTSWGMCELEAGPTPAAESFLFQQAAAQGQTVFAAGGDNGSLDCPDAPFQHTLAVDDPASQPYVTGVGGTNLVLTPFQTETVWNDADGAGGGGISTLWAMPPWQAGPGVLEGGVSSGAPCGAPGGSFCREVPDVASSAAPSHGYVIFFNGAWTTVGGSSAGPPLWAALTALANQRCGTSFGFFSPALYQIAAAGPGALTDVVAGNNDTGNIGLYVAGPGYDMASGLGSPVASGTPSALEPRMCVPPVLTAQAPPTSALVGSFYSYLFAATGAGVRFSVASGSLPPGLNLGPASGQLAGIPTVPGTFTFSVVASNGVAPAAVTPPITITVLQVPGFRALAPPGGRVGLAYRYDFGVVGGPPPTVVLAGGTIPPGLSLSAGGVLSGVPVAAGTFTFTLSASNGVGGPVFTPPLTVRVAPPFPPVGGYWEVASDGGLFAFGHAPFLGSAGGSHINQPVVGMAATPDGRGYWEVASDGGLFAYGDAAFLGSAGGSHINQPVVGMVATPDGGGYWEVASDGGLFAYGDAPFLGSAGGSHLNRPVVGMMATPDGRGYWEVASDGGLFAYGDAAFLGSAGGTHINQPVVGMAATPDGGGYWEVAADGGLFAYGDAAFLGSVGGSHINQPVVGMASTPDGGGYWEVAADGGLFAYGDAVFFGSTGGLRLNRPIVGMAVATG